MAYQTIDLILARLGRHGALTSSTNPTLADALAFQNGISAEIDFAIARHVPTTPVTTPAGLVTYLAAVEAWGVAAEVLKARFSDGSGPASEKAWSFYEKRYRDALAALREGTGLDDMAADELLPESYFQANPDEHVELGDIAEPVFLDTTVF